MSDIRSLMDKLDAIAESPAVGDGFFLEFGNTLEVETEIMEVTSDSIVIKGDSKLFSLLENLEQIAKKHLKEDTDQQLARQYDLKNLRPVGISYFIDAEEHDPGQYSYSLYQKVDDTDDPMTPAFKDLGFIKVSSYAKWPQVVAAAKQMVSGLGEAEYQGRDVPLNKPMKGDVKKSKVYVKDPKTGNVKKVNFGDPNMRIKKSNPKRRKSFRARHNCDNPGPKTKARYWSCRKW